MATKKKKKDEKYPVSETKPARPQRVHIKFLQDNSGSMCNRWSDCVGGFKSYVEDLRANKNVEYILSLTLFNSTFIPLIQGQSIHEMNAGILDNHRANGGTALYDALGSMLLQDDGDVDKTIYVIVTDGEENESRTWNKDSIHSVIDAKIKADRSTFQYLGAQPETWSDAAKMGLSVGQTVRYDQNNYIGTYAVMASATNNFSSSSLRSSRSMTASFADADLIKSANMCVVKDDDIHSK